MNEVRPTQVTPAVLPVASAASSQRTESQGKGVESLPASGKKLPVNDLQLMKENQKAQHKQEATTAPNIDQAVIEINDYVQSVQRDLHFSVDKNSGETVIRVRDKESGELIRQIPEDVFLNLAQNLKDNQAIHLFDAHG